MSSSNNSGRWNVSKVYCQLIVEPTKVETHLSIKLSKKNFGGILGPKSVRRTLWVYLGFIVHCGDRELFSRTMQLTIHLRLI